MQASKFKWIQITHHKEWMQVEIKGLVEQFSKLIWCENKRKIKHRTHKKLTVKSTPAATKFKQNVNQTKT